MDEIEGVDKRIYLQLEKIYPDKIVSKLSQNHSLYNEIRNRAKEQGTSTPKYVESLGFNYHRNGRLSSQYDINALKRLRNQYHCNISELADIFGITRQAIFQKLNIKNEPEHYWQGQEMTDKEIAVVFKMIEKEVYSYVDVESNLSIRLYKHQKESRSFALFIYNTQDKKTKVFFDDIPVQIVEKLIEHGYDKYFDQDFEIKHLILSSGVLINSPGEIEITGQDVGTHVWNKVYNRINKGTFSNFSRRDYIEYLGFKYVDGRYVSDEEIKELLSQYVVEGNLVHIPSSDPQRYRLGNLAHHRGVSSLKEFIESFGFEYKRLRITDAQDRIIEKLKKHYIVEGKKVYISSFDPLYNNLVGFAQNRNKDNVTDLLASWGFERMYLEDLPSDFEPYNWQQEIDEHAYNDEIEHYQQILDDLVFEENYIYLDSKTYLYSKLFVLAVRLGTTLNEMLKSWGYERVYNKPDEEKAEQKLWNSIIGQENVEQIGLMLENVMKIQGELSQSTTSGQRIERSRKLATEMKKLYNYRCQLCNYEEEGAYIPLIQKMDGTNYVEVHHIIPISEFDKVGDDSDTELDSYENVIVVCPHHHKVLHFHEGGFEELVEYDQGELLFKSKMESTIKVHTNYHLKARYKEKTWFNK